MSHIDDMEDDVGIDLVMTWIAMMTRSMTWQLRGANMVDDVAIDMAGDVASDISSTAHELMGRIQSGPPS